MNIFDETCDGINGPLVRIGTYEPPISIGTYCITPPEETQLKINGDLYTITQLNKSSEDKLNELSEKIMEGNWFETSLIIYNFLQSILINRQIKAFKLFHTRQFLNLYLPNDLTKLILKAI